MEAATPNWAFLAFGCLGVATVLIAIVVVAILMANRKRPKE